MTRGIVLNQAVGDGPRKADPRYVPEDVSQGRCEREVLPSDICVHVRGKKCLTGNNAAKMRYQLLQKKMCVYGIMSCREKCVEKVLPTDFNIG